MKSDVLPKDLDDLLECLVDAAQRGGDVLRRYFGQVLEVEEKSHPSDLRTQADVQSEKTILGAIRESHPDLAAFSEESGRVGSDRDYVVVIDPLDGSNNFILGVPSFTVSIALMHENETVLGVVYQPVLKRTYYAAKGMGAFLDGDRLQVNRQSEMRRATVSYTCGHLSSLTQAEQVDHALSSAGVKRLIRFWSPAYDFCLLASGEIECVINNGNDLYDFAAGRIIAREAGAMITDFAGNADTDTNDVFVASNGTGIHAVVLSVVRGIRQL